MKSFKPSYPFSCAVYLLKPVYTTGHGVTKKTYAETGDILNVSFKTYGGTETTNNDIYTVVDTAIIETWYNPDITSDCRIKNIATSTTYEILGNVENINMRNQFVKFKIRAVKGGA